MTAQYVASSARGLRDVFRKDHPDIVVDMLAPQPGIARIASAACFGDADGWRFTGANALYLEVPVEQRPPRDDEMQWRRDSIAFSVPDECHAIEVPEIERVREWIRDEDLDAHPDLDAVIGDAGERDRVVRELQESIEHEHYRANKLGRHGYPGGLPPEWHPEKSTVDRERLFDMAGMRKDAYLDAWKTTIGLSYSRLFETRADVLDVYEPNLEPRDLVALDVVDAASDDESYCRRCGSVWLEDLFMHVELRGYGGQTLRVCDHCVDRWAGTLELPGTETTRGPWTEAAAARAKDQRAERLGGQRRIEGYSVEEGEGA